MTRSSPPARRSAAGRARRRTTAARSSTASPRCWRAAGSSSSREVARRRGPVQVEGRRARWTRRSTAGSGTRAGPTRSPRSWAAANPVAGPFFNLSTPEPTGVVAVLAPQESSFLGLVSVIAPVIATGNTAVVVAAREVPAPGPLPGRGPGHLRPARAAWSTSSPAVPRRSRPRSPPTRTSTRSTWPARTTALAKELEIAAADNLKRVLRPQPVDDWTRRPRHRPHDGLPGDEDGLAPDGVAGRVAASVVLRARRAGSPAVTATGPARGLPRRRCGPSRARRACRARSPAAAAAAGRAAEAWRADRAAPAAPDRGAGRDVSDLAGDPVTVHTSGRGRSSAAPSVAPVSAGAEPARSGVWVCGERVDGGCQRIRRQA